MFPDESGGTTETSGNMRPILSRSWLDAQKANLPAAIREPWPPAGKV